MLKVLFIVPDFYPNTTGFSNASVGLVNTILKYGKDKYEVHVLTETPLPNGQPEFFGAHIHRYKNSKFDNRFVHSFFEKKKYVYVNNLITKNNIDVLFFETNTFPIFQNLLIRKFKGSVFVRIHSTADTEVVVYGMNENWFQKRMRKKIYSFMGNVQNVVATSDYYLDFVKTHFYCTNVYKIWDNRKFGLLFNTCDDNYVEHAVVMNNTFMTIGKLSNNGLVQKGFIDLLNAIYFLKLNHLLPCDFKLIMIGDGVKYDYLRSYIQQLDINNYIELIKSGTHEEIYNFISKSKAVILPSRYEGQSMFITEAISMGKPVIITSKNGMSNMINNGKNGFSVEAGNIASLSNAINKMITLDEKAIREMGKQSRDIFLQKFSGESVYNQFDFLMRTR